MNTDSQNAKLSNSECLTTADCPSEPLAIIVVGGSGDLARKKIYPALFALFCQDRLAKDFIVVGFARSEYTEDAFRELVSENLTCRYTPDKHSCARQMKDFLSRCHYHQGAYGDTDAYLNLFEHLRDAGGFHVANKLFYMAIPPSVFEETATALGASGLIPCCDKPHWARVVIEKPFGRDRESSDTLMQALGHVFVERQAYRIDHYLGKEVVQNVITLRFANQIFEPLWSHAVIESVDIIWKENIGTHGRGGYFDTFGIIRDVIQNHLLQILALVAMEEPVKLNAKAIRDAKVAVLKAVKPATLDNTTLGQYVAGTHADGSSEPGYLDDPTVPDDSRTATFAAVRLAIDNPRWRGVPFRIVAGKGAAERKTEVRIRFKREKSNLFCSNGACHPANELTIRIQPSEGVHFTIINKVPGEKARWVTTDLDLSYSRAFSNKEIPEAYESLLLDVVNGEKERFIRDDELAAAWDIFTPLLHEIDEKQVIPEPYPFGDESIFS
ncbi:MAG: glucose-6-phosphate dehydrogenase [Lentisphaeria bacterium]|nr:glucose-6-phosphate dehydrogenase [Lentisphaeria bacterium]